MCLCVGCSLEEKKNIYIFSIKGEGDTALEVEAQLYSDNSIIGK